ncbi:KAP family NTPase [Tenacibaculum finnmarkense]|uniref:KAP family NTPase n=1 Tax=Tenacibaculum finnmarkense TaxID=2781243 RepID=UPI001E455BEE|nr:KAP family NTPase [Tenacibaculum finnmarkense]MCD8411791.1 KAP family NTPase [Tenacibaculum finnmarkense genomovar ulcerans]
MISFAEALINKRDDCHKEFFIKDEERKRYYTNINETNYTNINETNIISLDVIDPSLFKGDDKLFEIIISKMFAKFQHEIKEGAIKLNQDDKRDLIKLFQKVFNNLKIVHNGKSDVYDKEAIEALSDLAYGTNLKDSFYKLVDVFLNTIGKGADFILIVIDDFDLNISGAHEMLEDIRQFLIQKNVIILIACKIEQLQDAVNHEIVEKFKTIINNDTLQNVFLSEEVNDKSERYLDKLLPIEKRISTPSFDLNNSSKEVLNINGKGSDENFYKGKSIEKTILELIYRKTKHIITSNDFQNIIIPSTIRNIANVTTFIYREENIEAYKRVLFKGINSDLKTDYRAFFKELEITSNKSLNQYIVNWIGSENIKRLENNQADRSFKRLLYINPKDVENQDLKPKDNEIKLYRKIKLITEASSYANVSYADVMFLIINLEEYRLFSDIDLFKLYSYIKLYYSLRISLSNKTELIQLINGEMTNSELKFLPSESGASDRHEFIIESNPVELFKLIEDNDSDKSVFIINFNNPINDSDSENSLELNKEKNGSTTNTQELCYWLSFFFTQLGTLESRYRNKPEIQHERSIYRNQKDNSYQKVTFNSVAFIHNTLSPEIVLKRFFSDDNQNQIKNTPLFSALETWNKKLKDDSVYYEIFNFQLFDEFLNELYKVTSKENIKGNYGTDLYTFIVNGISNVTKVFKVKYPYLDLTPLLENPIIKYWKENLNSVTDLLDRIRDIKKEDKDRKEAIKIAKGYVKNITDSEKDKAITISYLMKKIAGFSFKDKDKIINVLTGFQKLFKDAKTDSEKTSDYLKEITYYLNNLKD